MKKQFITHRTPFPFPQKSHVYFFDKDHKFTNIKTLNQEEPIDEPDKDMFLHIRWARQRYVLAHEEQHMI